MARRQQCAGNADHRMARRLHLMADMLSVKALLQKEERGKVALHRMARKLEATAEEMRRASPECCCIPNGVAEFQQSGRKRARVMEP